MENIYNPKCFRASEPFNTKEYFRKFAEMCPVSAVSQDENGFRQDLIKDMGIAEDLYDFDTLEESCSTDLLQLLDEPQNAIKNVPAQITAKTKFDVSYPITESAKQLKVVRCKKIVEERTNMKMITNKRFLKSAVIPKQIAYSSMPDIVPGSNFVYSIFVYKPFAISYGQRNSAEKMRFSMEIEALGTNTLADVVDTIECISNMGLFKEVENTMADLKNLCNAKEQYPSQTVFINGVFYNDFRSDKAVDYSKVLMEWTQENNIGKFTTADMDKTTLDTLTPRFGYPYVYIHHGNCEHIISFADARLIQSGDSLIKSHYPRIYSITRYSTPLCFLCNRAPSKWVVKDCDLLPHDKVFLCTECCDSYLYIDGVKIGEFKLYPFYDMNCDLQSI